MARLPITSASPVRSRCERNARRLRSSCWRASARPPRARGAATVDDAPQVPGEQRQCVRPIPLLERVVGGLQGAPLGLVVVRGVAVQSPPDLAVELSVAELPYQVVAVDLTRVGLVDD